MSLAALIDQDFKKYLSDDKNRESCWFFVHIPKTAGTSFNRDIVAVRGPSYNVHVEGDDRPVPHYQKIVDAARKFDQNIPEGHYKWASGHIPIEILSSEVKRWHDFQLVTMLRDPVRRVISEYRYQRTNLHPNHKEFISEFSSLESYATSEGARNKMFKFLRPDEKATLDECIKFIVNRFMFVGIVEMYPASFHLLTSLMGHPHLPSSHERKTPEIDLNAVEFTEVLQHKIRQLNKLDEALYNFFSAIMLPTRRFVEHSGGGTAP